MGLLKLLKSTLHEADLSTDGVVSQTYDGASVMSGCSGGLQKLFSKLCDRKVPYIHCYCHRLKLVIDELLENVSGVADHFSLVSDLYAFFKLTEINKIYTGVKLKRLIETRWSGHFKSIEVIYSESDKLIKCLKDCLNSATVKYGTEVHVQVY